MKSSAIQGPGAGVFDIAPPPARPKGDFQWVRQTRAGAGHARHWDPKIRGLQFIQHILKLRRNSVACIVQLFNDADG